VPILDKEAKGKENLLGHLDSQLRDGFQTAPNGFGDHL
jgi:hypothetical protein